MMNINNLQFTKRDGWVDVLNNGKIVDHVTIFNKSYSYDFVIEQLEKLYKEKYDIESVMLAIINKHKVKTVIHLDDIKHLENMLDGWIMDDAKLNTFRYIRSEVRHDSFHTAYNYILNMYSGLKNSKIKMEMDKFYLLESY